MDELIERLRKSAEHVRSTSKGGMEYEARLMEEAAAALEAAREDAERYRWLRDIPSQLRADHDHNPASGGWDAPIFWHGLSKPGDELQGRDLDIAIDQARGKGVAG